MLGIFLLACLMVYALIRLRAYWLLDDYPEELAAIDGAERTFQVCHRAVMLYALGKVVLLIGYYGCAWPYLFIEGIDRTSYIAGVVMFGVLPLPGTAILYYLDYRNSRGYIRIGTDQIEYQRRKHFIVNIRDIKKIFDSGVGGFQIHLKEKGKKPLSIDANGFYRKDELCSLMRQLRDDALRAPGRDRSLVYRLGIWRLGRIFIKCYLPLTTAAMGLMLVYSSYCCIDYDFVKRDYTALFNALYADANQTENAWEHYVRAAVNYTELEYELQETIKKCSDSGEFDFSDDQKAALRKWLDDNASSWAGLKKATSIAYCNAAYDDISLRDSISRRDFSHPRDTGYGQINSLYNNTDAARLAGLLDLDWLDLFYMQLASANHFINAKTSVEQLVGYGMLGRSIKLIASQKMYEPSDLCTVRQKLKEHFPEGLPLLRIEGEILIACSYYDFMINYKKIPVQTPLNSLFYRLGSRSGAETYVRRRYAAALEQAKRGLEIEPPPLSILDYPLIVRSLVFGIFDEGMSGIYKISQRAKANLAAAYLVLDLEEYQLTKGSYPVEVSELRQAGLNSQLPDDPDSDGKIIYRNDGQRAILYAVGPNGKDDDGYKDDEGRDDKIYWQRSLNDEIGK